MRHAIAAFMALMGLGIATIWTKDIRSSPELDRTAGLLRAREPGSGTLLLPHWLAEYATALALCATAIGLLRQANWGRNQGLAALGALTYTSLNSLGWALARRARAPYALPMLLGLMGGLGSILALLRTTRRPST